MKQKKPTKQIIRYWHPRLGGWYHGISIEMVIDDNGNGLVRVRDLGTRATLCVPEEDVREVAA